ncbi:MAG: hypothetical protein ACK5HL_02610 [Bacilli bacterium]
MIINGITFNINIKKAKQKKTYLRVDKNNINITTPKFTTKKNINKFILENKEFILKQYFKYIDSIENIYYLGRKFKKEESSVIYIDYENNIFYYNEKIFVKLTKHIL